MADQFYNWAGENQFFLMGMIKSVRDQLQIYLNSFNNESGEYFSGHIDETQNLKKFAEEMAAPPAINNLADKLQLSDFEKNILLLCTGTELDSEIADLLLSSQAGFSYPSFSLAAAIFPDADWNAFTPGAPLRYWRLLELNKSQLLTRSLIKIDEHILHYLAGVNDLPEKLKEIITPIDAQDLLVPSEIKLADTILQICSQYREVSAQPVLHFLGNEPAEKLRIAAYTASQLDSTLHEISDYAIPASIPEITELSRLWNREARLKNYVLFIDAGGLDLTDKIKVRSLIHFIENIEGLLIVGSEQWTPELRKAKFSFHIEKPAQAEQLQLWKNTLGAITPAGELERLVSQFNLNAETIQKAGIEITSHIKTHKLNGNGIDIQRHIWQTCCNYARPQIDELAQRIKPSVSWDDIVLPETQKNILKEIAIHVRQRNKVYSDWGFEKKGSRGLGISALFAGESGTGKTMAAEVLANDLGLDLYRIDLSNVINKYIGETEKNLKKIFDAAENGGAILLFDEADALFGKRSDVKDSHDRYSNIEVSYLLQRMEAYRGLAILTTNMKNSLDKAFMRRIRFVVQFQFPDHTQRAEIWTKIFPAGTPQKDIDTEQLAKLNLSGGSIRNVALNAAFFAADEMQPVLMSHISRAAKSEYLKLEKPFNSFELK